LGFLYFFPCDASFSLDRLSEANKQEEVDKIFKGRGLTTAHGTHGPEGKRGSLIQINHPAYEAVNCRYSKDEQVWRKCGESHYIGYWKDKLPNAAALVRPELLEGENIDIKGDTWRVVVCSPSRTSLPHTFDISPDGSEWVPSVSAEYEPVMKMCEEAMEFAEGQDAHVKVQYCMSLLAKVLGLNYHVGKRELAMLGLVTTESFGLLWNAIIGLTTIEREAERIKKQVATDGNGEEASRGVEG